MKAYIAPTLAVVPLQHHVALLSASEQFTVNVNEESVDPEDTW